MSLLAILAILARPLIEAAVLAFGQVLMGFLNTWQASRDAKALGRAEATRDAALEAARVAREMEDVPLTDWEELLKRIEEGKA